MTVLARLTNVTKKYGKQVALDNLSLEIPSGVVFALLGENGAGKSTTIKILMGLEPATSGTAEVLGMDCRKQGDLIRRKCGYIPESPVLYDWMTVSEIGWFTAGFYDEQFFPKFLQMAASYELPLEKKTGTLSKGGRAKVALALAMASEPQLLVLDEPTSGLDTLVRRQFLESMVDVAATGRTVVLSSHQIGEVERVADHVAIINKGKLLANDTLDNLKSQFERWVVTFSGADNALPELNTRIILHEGAGGRRQQLTVHRPDPESLWKLRDHTGVNDVEVHTPTLEEIFVSLLKQQKLGDAIASDSVTQSTPG